MSAKLLLHYDSFKEKAKAFGNKNEREEY